MFDSGLLIFAWFVIAVLHESRRIKAKLFFFSPDLLPLLWSCSQLIVLCVCFLLQILFMNKIDLFQEKILHSGRHLRLYLPQFKGRTDLSS